MEGMPPGFRPANVFHFIPVLEIRLRAIRRGERGGHGRLPGIGWAADPVHMGKPCTQIAQMIHTNSIQVGW